MKSSSPRTFVPVLALLAASIPFRAISTTCDPVIGLTGSLLPPFMPAEPRSSVRIEVPNSQRITLSPYVLNLGCAPLEWKVRDVQPGTELDSPWISESPDTGAVPPAVSEPGSQRMTATFGPLPGGRYDTELQFTCNDPIRPRVVFALTIISVAPTPTQRHTIGQLKARFRE